MFLCSLIFAVGTYTESHTCYKLPYIAAHDTIRFRLSHHVNRRFWQYCPLRFPELSLASFSFPLPAGSASGVASEISTAQHSELVARVCVCPNGNCRVSYEMPDKLLCCLGEAIEHGGSDSHVVIPRSALVHLSRPALTPFGMSESKTSYRKFLEFCKNDFYCRQMFTQSVLILDFLLSIPLVTRADRVSIVSALGSTITTPKRYELSTPGIEPGFAVIQ